jgi:two-component system chemotaxis response regulator CheY
VVILSLNFSHVAFRVTFNEERKESMAIRRRILVTEDSAVIRTIIGRTLEKFGFEVAQAENGRRSVEVYREFRPHLVIMDLVMPEMGGLEAMTSILESDPHAKFIILTSTARRDQVLSAKKLGVRSYLIKPFQPEALMKAINQFFTAHKDA